MGLLDKIGKIGGKIAPFVSMVNPAIGAAIGMASNYFAQKDAPQGQKFAAGLAGGRLATSLLDDINTRGQNQSTADRYSEFFEAWDNLMENPSSEETKGEVIDTADPEGSTDEETTTDQEAVPTTSGSATMDAAAAGNSEVAAISSQVAKPVGQADIDAFLSNYFPTQTPDTLNQNQFTPRAVPVSPYTHPDSQMGRAQRGFADGGRVTPIASAVPTATPQETRLDSLQAKWQGASDAVLEHDQQFASLFNAAFNTKTMGEHAPQPVVEQGLHRGGVVVKRPAISDMQSMPAPQPTPVPQPFPIPGAVRPFDRGRGHGFGRLRKRIRAIPMARNYAEGGRVDGSTDVMMVEEPIAAPAPKPSQMQMFYGSDSSAVAAFNMANKNLRAQLLQNMANDGSINEQEKALAVFGTELEMRRRYSKQKFLEAQQYMGVDDTKAAKLIAAAFGVQPNGGDVQVTTLGPGEYAYTTTDEDGNPTPVMKNPETGEDGPRIGVINADTIQDFIDMAGNPGMYAAAGAEKYEEYVIDRTKKEEDIKRDKEASARGDEQIRQGDERIKNTKRGLDQTDKRISQEDERLRIAQNADKRAEKDSAYKNSPEYRALKEELDRSLINYRNSSGTNKPLAPGKAAEAPGKVADFVAENEMAITEHPSMASYRQFGAYEQSLRNAGVTMNDLLKAAAIDADTNDPAAVINEALTSLQEYFPNVGLTADGAE